MSDNLFDLGGKRDFEGQAKKLNFGNVLSSAGTALGAASSIVNTFTGSSSRDAEAEAAAAAAAKAAEEEEEAAKKKKKMIFGAIGGVSVVGLLGFLLYLKKKS